MSAALALTSDPRSPGTASGGVDWSLWVPASEAAQILGRDEDGFRRTCREQLMTLGKAAQLTATGTLRPTWFVHRSYDLRLGAGAIGEKARSDAGAMSDLIRYPRAKVNQALERRDCVMELRAARATRPGKMADWIQSLVDTLRLAHVGLSITTRTLYRWDSLYQSPSDLAKLIDTRGGNTRGSGDPAAWDHFKDIFLDSREPDIIDCWRRTKAWAKAEGITWTSYRACAAQKDTRIPPEVQAFHRKSVRYKRQVQPTISKATGVHLPGVCWEGDHRQSNFWCVHEGRLVRPWLTAWIDRGSRKITGYEYSASGGNSSTIMSALRMGIMDPANHGGPDLVWIDNGKDYDSYALNGRTKKQAASGGATAKELSESITSGLFHLLSIEPHFAIPHNPNGKPLIEGWFETLEDFDKSFTTYCGRSEKDKPEGLNELLKKDNWHTLPTFEHVKERLALRIEGYNQATGEERGSARYTELLGGLSPHQFLLERCPRTRQVPDPAVLDMLLAAHHEPVGMTRDGLPVDIGSSRLWAGRFDLALTPYKPGIGVAGKKLRVTHNPNDLSTVRVYDMDWRFICETKVYGAPKTQEELKEVAREKSAYRKAIKAVKAGRTMEHETPLETAQRLRMDRLTAADAAAPRVRLAGSDLPAVKLVQTPLDQAVKQVQRAALRKAAGAEAISREVDDGPVVDLLGGDGMAGLSRLAVAHDDSADDDLLAPFPLKGRDEDDSILDQLSRT